MPPTITKNHKPYPPTPLSGDTGAGKSPRTKCQLSVAYSVVESIAIVDGENTQSKQLSPSLYCWQVQQELSTNHEPPHERGGVNRVNDGECQQKRKVFK